MLAKGPRRSIPATHAYCSICAPRYTEQSEWWASVFPPDSRGKGRNDVNWQFGGPYCPRLLQFCFLGVAVAGCGSSPHRATEGEQHAAAVAYVDCLDTAVEALDDGVSDAMSVAYAIKGRCRKEFLVFVETCTRGQNPYVTRAMQSGLDKNLEKPISIVLGFRAAVHHWAATNVQPPPSTK